MIAGASDNRSGAVPVGVVSLIPSDRPNPSAAPTAARINVALQPYHSATSPPANIPAIWPPNPSEFRMP